MTLPLLLKVSQKPRGFFPWMRLTRHLLRTFSSILCDAPGISHTDITGSWCLEVFANQDFWRSPCWFQVEVRSKNPFSTRFYMYQVVGNGISEPSTDGEVSFFLAHVVEAPNPLQIFWTKNSRKNSGFRRIFLEWSTDMNPTNPGGWCW